MSGKILGLILAGGRGSRMGGADKGFVQLAGRPLLGHAIARLAPQCADLAISANGEAGLYAPFEAPVLPDASADRPGPLAGILAGLEHAARHGFACVATAPVDTPFLPGDLVARLDAARRERGARIAVGASGAHVHHAVALWPVDLASDMRDVLAREERGVGRFIARYLSASVEWPVAPFDPFFNVNTPEDLAVAERLFATSGRG